MQKNLLLFGLLESLLANPVRLVNRNDCTIIALDEPVMGVDPVLNDDAEVHFELNGDEIECGSTIDEFDTLQDTLRVNLGNLDDNGNGGTLANYAVQVSAGGEFANPNGACETGITQSEPRSPFGAVSFDQEDTDIIVRDTTVSIIGSQGFNRNDVRITETCTITITNLEIDENELDDDEEEEEEEEEDENENQGNGFVGDEDADLMQFLIVVISLVGIGGVVLLGYTNRSQKEITEAIIGKVDPEA
eukprot:augustus_masked-scaffold_50-processed-gene-1.20-mRNA-1 protein AED:1.00 eAED:1.00 QI:0/-1/0/0/-1/1/1/0/246